MVARNLPEHARNAIHTDAGARAAGFPRALVAGVTTYALLTHPLLAAWGTAWLASGGAEVRFRRPVFDGDLIRCRVAPAGTDDADAVVIEAVTGAGDAAASGHADQPRAVCRAVQAAGPVPTMRDGERLATVEIALEGEFGSGYGERAGDDLALCRDHGVVHPAVWPALANHVVHTQVARGSWVHTRSIVRHHAMATAGSTAQVSATVVRRFEAHGERAVLDVAIVAGSRLVATLEHEAIVALP